MSKSDLIAPLNLSLNDCRAEFIKWAAPVYDLELHRTGTFADDTTRALWRAWRSAWELQDARVKGAMA